MDIDFGFGLSEGTGVDSHDDVAGILRTVFYGFGRVDDCLIEVAIGRFGCELYIAGSRKGTVVFYAGFNGFLFVDVHPQAAAKVFEGLVYEFCVFCFGCKDDVPVAAGCDVKLRQAGIGLLFRREPDDVRKVRYAGLDGCPGCRAICGYVIEGFACNVLAHGNARGIELHIACGVDLAEDGNGTAGIDRDRPMARLDIGQGGFRDFFIPVVGQGIGEGVEVHFATVRGDGIRRRHDIEGARVDDAGFADGHAFGAEEIEVAADLFIMDGVYCAVNVHAVVDEVDQVG